MLVESEEGFERWDGHGALGYLVLEEIVRATLDDPPERARVVVARRCFPTGVLGYWVRRLAEGGLVAALTATSPRRLRIRTAARRLTGTNPLAIAIPSSDGAPVVADVSMGAVTHGDVLAGRAAPDELVPFGGEHAHKAFALAVGLELLVAALAGPEHGAVLVVARPDHDPVPGVPSGSPPGRRLLATAGFVALRRLARRRSSTNGSIGVLAVDALLEVLDARPVLEALVAEDRRADPRSPCAASSSTSIHLLARRLAEQLLVDAEEAAQLLERPLVVVDPEVDEDVREARRSPAPGRRRGLPRTAGRGCRRRLPAPRRGSRAGVRRAAGPCVASNVSASASTVSAETRMFPCAA